MAKSHFYTSISAAIRDVADEIEKHLVTDYLRNEFLLIANKLDGECLFLPPVVAALDEYGIPFALGQRLLPLLGTTDDIDVALNTLRDLNVAALNLPEFEKELVVEAKNGL